MAKARDPSRITEKEVPPRFFHLTLKDFLIRELRCAQHEQDKSHAFMSWLKN